MRQEQTVDAKANDFEPLLPIDIIRPPQQRGDMDAPDILPPAESDEVLEEEIKEKRSPGYKGDINAPVDAPHPLAESPVEPL